MRKVLLVVSLVLLMMASGWSFDGNRKGFVLGGGLGLAPTAKFEIDNTSYSHSKAGIGLNLIIGYAWDEMNMIVYEGNIAGYSESGVDVTQGFNGASWYHYFGPQGKSFFTTVGLGAYVFSIDEYDADPGGAILLGGGYEFARHWQVSAYFSVGKTSDGPIDFNHNHFNILIGGVAF